MKVERKKMEKEERKVGRKRNKRWRKRDGMNAEYKVGFSRLYFSSIKSPKTEEKKFTFSHPR